MVVSFLQGDPFRITYCELLGDRPNYFLAGIWSLICIDAVSTSLLLFNAVSSIDG